MDGTATPYPATMTYDAPERIANWRPLVHWFLAIPHLVVMYLLNIAGNVVGVLSWVVILFTGKLPESLAGVQCMVVRYQLRLTAYIGFLFEEYPPFSFDSTGADPGDAPRLRVELVPQLEDRNRVTVFFRILLAIPQLIALVALGIACALCFVIAFFAVLFTGRWPSGLRDFVVGVLAWSNRVQAYLRLLTDEYPPFELRSP